MIEVFKIIHKNMMSMWYQIYHL